MTQLRGFIGGAYSLQSVNIDCQRSVNLFPQITESGNQSDGAAGALISAPGKRLLATIGAGPVRATYATSAGGFLVVSGSEVYAVNTSWAPTLLGNLLTSSGPVSVVDNGTQACIVDGSYGYIVSMSTATLTQITDAGFPGANTVIFNGSYFLVNNPGTNQFARSASWDGLVWDALDFITAEANPDQVVAVRDFKNQVAVLGQQTVEYYWNSGADTTYSRIDGALIEYGCGAAQTVCKFANTMLWLGGGTTGAGIIWQAEGYVPKRISNHGVEVAIRSYGDISDATAWVYQHEGHAFYTLNFPGAKASWVYDISTGQWHERCALATDGTFDRDRAEVYAWVFGEHVVGDYENGNIYALDYANFTDNGTPLVRMRRAPHLSADGKRMFFSRLQMMARVGSGLDGDPAVGTDPQVELRYSDDFGHTWSHAKTKSLGKLGDYAARVIWRQLGQARNRVFEVRVSDPVEVTILGAEMDLTAGAN